MNIVTNSFFETYNTIYIYIYIHTYIYIHIYVYIYIYIILQFNTTFFMCIQLR